MKVLWNIVLGLILGIFIYKQVLVNPRKHGPNSKFIVNEIYQKDDKYYRFIPEICPCPI